MNNKILVCIEGSLLLHPFDKKSYFWQGILDYQPKLAIPYYDSKVVDFINKTSYSGYQTAIFWEDSIIPLKKRSSSIIASMVRLMECLPSLDYTACTIKGVEALALRKIDYSLIRLSRNMPKSKIINYEYPNSELIYTLQEEAKAGVAVAIAFPDTINYDTRLQINPGDNPLLWTRELNSCISSFKRGRTP